jgi:5-hydroxyisourate hydrolase-like protein (transthyretin family)
MLSFSSSPRVWSKGRAAVILLVGLVVAAFLAMGMSGAAFAAKSKVAPFTLTVLTSKTEALPADQAVPVSGAKLELWDDEGSGVEDTWEQIDSYTTDATGKATITAVNTADFNSGDEYAIYIDPSSATPDLDAAGWYIPSDSDEAVQTEGNTTHCQGSTSSDFDYEGDPCEGTSFYSSDLNPSGTAYLSASSSLTGTISDPDGNPATSAQTVVALRRTVETDGDHHWDPIAQETVSGQSTFDISGLSAGEYVVEGEATPGVTNWTQSIFDVGLANPDAATPVTVDAGGSSVQDVKFLRAGEIQGTANLSSGGSGNIEVDAFPINSQNRAVSISDKGVVSTVVAAGSDYSLNVAPGTYKLRFTPEGAAADAYYPAWYGDFADSTDATKVTVSASFDVEQNINETLAEGLGISGTVTAPGESSDGIVVDAIPTGDDEEDEMETTVSGGAYEFEGLAPSEYTLEFSDPNGNYPDTYYNGTPNGTQDPDAARVFEQASGQVTADFTYSNVATLTIHVATPSGKALSDIAVIATPSTNGLITFDSGIVIGTALHGKPGTYELDDLVPGQAYAILFASDSTASFYPQFWGGEQDSEPTKLYTPVAGANFLDTTVASSAALSGTVTSTSKKAVANIEVDLFDFDGNAWNLVSAAETSSKGKYSFPQLATGSYTVQFGSEGESAGYIPSFAGGAADAADATSVYIAPGNPAVLNGTLNAGGSISGILTFAGTPGDDFGEEVEPVALTGTPGHFTAATPVDGGETFTNSSGKFKVSGLPTGYYSLTFDDEGDGVYGNPYKDPTTDPSALVIHVVEGQVTTLSDRIQIPLLSEVATAHVSGTLDLSMAPNATDVDGDVYFTAADGDITDATIADDGTFEADLIPGTYTVDSTLTDEDHLSESYVAAEQTITVTGDQTLSIPVVQSNPLAFTTAPTLISTNPDGSAEASDVGTTYTVDPSDPPTVNVAGAEFSYEWLRNGVPIRGTAGATSYTLVGADAGTSVQLEVVALDPNDPFVEVPDFATAIAVTPSSELYNTAPPTTSADSAGTVTPGETIDAKPGQWNNVSGVQYTYAWIHESMGGAGAGKVALGYGPTFTPTVADVGTQIKLQVSASKLGYTTPDPATSTVELTVDPLGKPTPKVLPKVTKKSIGGVTTFTVTPGTWTVAGTTPTYQWNVDGQADTDDADATTNTFTFDPSAPSDGTESGVTVTVGATKTGYADGSTSVVAQLDTTQALTTSDTGARDGSGPILGLNTHVFVGDVLTATTDDITYTDDQTAGTKFSYQWYHAQGSSAATKIAGATKASYTIPASDDGLNLSVVVSAASSTHGSAANTETAGWVQPGSALADHPATFTSTSTSATVGTAVKYTAGAWSVSSVTDTYKWYGCPSANDCTDVADLTNFTQIAGATSASYTPVAGDIGSTIVPVLTGAKTGYQSESVQGAALVVAAKPGTTAKPSVAPSVTVSSDGTNYIAHSGTWPVGGSVTYQWVVQGEATGDSDPTFPTPLNQSNPGPGANTTVSLEVTYAARGYATTVVDVLAQKGTAPTSNGVPVIGDDQVGQTLEVLPEPYELFGIPSGLPATLTYQWYSGAKAIPGATKYQWLATAAYVNTEISVKETLTSPDYATATNQTPQVKLLEGSPIYGSPQLKYTGTAVHPGSVVSIDLGTGFPAGVSHTYQWRVTTTSGWADIQGATKSTFTVPLADLDHGIMGVLGTTKPGYESTSEPVGSVGVVAAAVLAPISQPYVGSEVAAGPPELENAYVGQPLTVTPGSWDVAGLTFSYAWFQDGVIIPGATKATFTPTSDQLGTELTATVTAKAAGYDTVTVEADGAPQVALGDAPTATTKPKVTGTASFGSVLTATSGVWSLDDLTFSYQWFYVSGNTAITGATSSTYTVAGGDSGKSVYVEVTARRDGYDAGTADSTATASIH